MKAMKSVGLSMWLLVATFTPACGQTYFNITGTNESPGLGVTDSWEHPEEPGHYFWSGFRLGLGVVLFALVVAMTRNTVTTREDL